MSGHDPSAGVSGAPAGASVLGAGRGWLTPVVMAIAVAGPDAGRRRQCGSDARREQTQTKEAVVSETATVGAEPVRGEMMTSDFLTQPDNGGGTTGPE
jgi:hypothetical protein